MCKLAMRHNRACFAHLWGWKSSCKERKKESKQASKKVPPKAKHKTQSPSRLLLKQQLVWVPPSIYPKKKWKFYEKNLHSIHAMWSRNRALPLTKILNLARSFPSSFFPPPWPHPSRVFSFGGASGVPATQPPPPHERLSLKGHFCGLLFSCFAFSPIQRPF
jgi:hypothetical protein